VRITWDHEKNEKLKRDRGVSFEEALEIFKRAYVIQHKNDDPEQYKAIGLVKGKLVTLIVEIRQDHSGEYERLVTLWKSTKSEVTIYEQNT
jgi:uncharacterized DUF497 family protein